MKSKTNRINLKAELIEAYTSMGRRDLQFLRELSNTSNGLEIIGE